MGSKTLDSFKEYTSNGSIFKPGDAVQFRIKGQSVRGIYVNYGYIIWSNPITNKITQSSIADINIKNGMVSLDTKYKHSKRHPDNIVNRAVASEGSLWKGINYRCDESFVRWCILDERDEAVPSLTGIVMTAAFGFYVGGIPGAIIGGIVAYNMQ